jgi:DNA-binding LacI/PurR family transcriptional regulator/anti-anti-sigma regulatory factor/putative methionine-R-sulfoxide reductase with GAF domain
MGDRTSKRKVGGVKPSDSRPTIGLLAEVGRSPYHRALWEGFIDAAAELDVNLIWYLSDVLRPSENGVQRSIFHDLIAAERVDGLLVSGTLGNYVATAEFRNFVDHYRPMPMVGITQTPGLPCVIVDNGKGVRDTVAHLVEVHEYRRIAYIRGPENNEEAMVRYRAYVDVLAEHDLPLDPDLVAPGTFVYEAGVDAVRLLLDEREVQFEAIVAANDWMALGALRALEDRGIRVPEDVALVGFDDTREVMVSSPPLTTVRQPIQQLGYAGIRAMLKLLAGEQVPEQTMLPTQLVVRQSCGCVEPAVVHVAVGPLAEKREPLKDVIVAQWEEILSEMAQGMEEALSSFPNWAEQLLTAFLDEIVPRSAAGKQDVEIDLQGPFLLTLHHVLQQASMAGSQVNSLHKVISVMRRRILPHVADVTTLARVEALFDQGRVATDRMVQRNWTLQEVEKAEWNDVLSNLRGDLSTRIEMGRLADLLSRRLPQLGFSSFCLSLYEGQEHFTPWSRLTLAFEGGKRVEVDAARRRFLTRRLTPDELTPQKRRHTWIVEPLYFEENQFGCFILEVGPRDADVYRSLTSLISGSMQDSLLIRQLEVRKVQMVTAAEVSHAASGVLDLDELIQQVVDLAQERFGLYYAGLFLIEDEWAVLRAGTGEAGRQMLAKGHRLKVGGDSTVGRCVTDRQTCVTSGVGQKAVRFEDSLLAEMRSEMALPLISRDKIVGALTVQSTQEAAFGDEDMAVFQTVADQLANAITNAWLYEEAQRAYAEVEQQVRERTEELEREVKERERAQAENLGLQQEIIEAQRHALQELSTPIIPVLEGIIVVPLIGSIDTMRARDLTRALLAGIRQHRARVVIVDITGVPMVDSGVADHLNKTIQAARLKGARTIITGISDAVAETIVDLGIDWGGIETLSDLQTGLVVAFSSLGVKLAR